MAIKGKQGGKKVSKQASASDFYSEYLKAGKNSAVQKKILLQVIKLVLQDPESKYSETLIKIAAKGDKHCSAAIEPLMAVFWDGDFEWQEEIARILGEITHLAPLPLRIRVGQFLGHVAVSSVFVGGSGVDHAASTALGKISSHLFAIEKARLIKSPKLIIRKEGEVRKLFNAETQSAVRKSY